MSDQLIGLWLNTSILNYMILSLVYMRVLIGIRVDAIWALEADCAHLRLSDVLKMMGYSFIPFYGTWVAICSLRVWGLKNQELRKELCKRPFFIWFKPIAALEKTE